MSQKVEESQAVKVRRLSVPSDAKTSPHQVFYNHLADAVSLPLMKINDGINEWMNGLPRAQLASLVYLPFRSVLTGLASCNCSLCCDPACFTYTTRSVRCAARFENLCQYTLVPGPLNMQDRKLEDRIAHGGKWKTTIKRHVDVARCSAVAEGPRDALRRLICCQLLQQLYEKWHFKRTVIGEPVIERVQAALADISRSALCCHGDETRAPIANPPNR